MCILLLSSRIDFNNFGKFIPGCTKNSECSFDRNKPICDQKFGSCHGRSDEYNGQHDELTPYLLQN